MRLLYECQIIKSYGLIFWHSYLLGMQETEAIGNLCSHIEDGFSLRMTVVKRHPIGFREGGATTFTR